MKQFWLGFTIDVRGQCDFKCNKILNRYVYFNLNNLHFKLLN